MISQNAEDIILRLNEPLTQALLAPGWERTLADSNRPAAFLQPETVRRNCALSGLPDEAVPFLERAAARIAADEALGLLCRHAHYLVFERPSYTDFRGWPTFENTLNDMAGAFWLLIALDTAPRVERLHASLGVPDEIRRATASRLAVAERYRTIHAGAWGLKKEWLPWVRHHASGRLFRIGRMEYILAPFAGRVAVWRRRADGAVIALMPPGLPIGADGQVEAPWQAPGPQTRTSSLEVTARWIEGYPVSPDGCAGTRSVKLPRRDWEPVLQKGYPAISMHIPPGGSMTLDKCAESFFKARDFYRRFFSSEPPCAVVCSSWIFSTQLEEILGSESNMVVFQRELYLHPVPPRKNEGMEFIFDRDDLPPRDLPRDTSLQRKVADFMSAGGVLRGGGMFFLLDDLDHFGHQHYRRQFAALDAELKNRP